MLGIVFIVLIGRYFYKLSEQYHQNKWLFAILGIVSYYAGTMIAGVIFGVLDALFGWGMDWDNKLVLALIALPFGIGAAYLFYYILKKKWEKTVVVETDEIQEIGKPTDSFE